MFSSNFVKWELLAAAPWPAAGARVSHLHEQDFGAPDLRSLYGILDCSPFSVPRLLHVWEGIYFLCGYFLRVIVCLGKKICQIYYNNMVLIHWKAKVWETEKLQSNVIGSADQSKTELSLPFYLLVPLFLSFDCESSHDRLTTPTPFSSYFSTHFPPNEHQLWGPRMTFCTCSYGGGRYNWKQKDMASAQP